MRENNGGRAQGLVSRVRALVGAIKAAIVEKNRDGNLLRGSVIGLLIVANALVFVSIPVLILATGDAERNVEQTAGEATDERIGPLPTFSFSFSEGTPKEDQIAADESLRIGIDVSDHQGTIDWPAVAANGIEFAFIKVGARGYSEGKIIPDEQYLANIEGATATNIQVGVYFFSQAINEQEALEEAEYVLKMLDGRKLDYPVVYDFESVSDSEGRANQLSAKQRSSNAITFCEHIENSGYTAMLYGNLKDMAHYDPALLLRYDVWFAEYDSNEPHAVFPIKIWQFTSSGVVNGISTRVDLNVHFAADDLRRLPNSIVRNEE